MSAAKSVGKPSSSKRRETALTEDRRRSNRAMIRVPLVLHHGAEGEAKSIPAFTVSVNVFGATICAAISLPVEARCEIEHKMTRERITVRVIRKSQGSPEGFLIPVEFETPSADFWHIAFPPDNWKPLDS